MTKKESKPGFQLRRRITIAFLLLAVMPLCGTTLVVGWKIADKALTSSYLLQQAKAAMVADRSLFYFREVGQEVQELLRFQSFMALSRDQQEKIFEELLANREIYRQIALIDNADKELACFSNMAFDCPEVLPIEWQGREEYTVALESGRVTYGPVGFQVETGVPWQRIAFPIMDYGHGVVSGVLVVEIKLQHLWRLIGELPSHPGEDHYVLDAESRLISHANPSLVLQGKHFSPIPGRMLQPGLEGKEVLVATAVFRLGDREFTVVVERLRGDVFLEVYGHLVVIMTALLAALLAALVFAKITDIQVFRPLAQLKDAARELVAGDYRARVVRPGSAEFSEVAMSFNQMAHSLTHSLSALSKEVQERQEAESAANDGHERLKTILDSLDAIVYVADMETHELIFVNKYVRDLFGEIEGMICWQVLHAEQTGPCDFCTNKKIVDAGGKPTVSYPWEFRNSKTARWYYIVDRALRWVDGRIVRLEIATDITEHKQAEEELRHYRTHLEELVKTRTAELEEKNNELEKINKLFVGRELRMIELKERIKELEEKWA
jgi:PAS domain S-box-containing protein